MVRTRAELAEAIRRFVGAVERFVPVERVFLFGSYAREAPRPYSDIDLAVISPSFCTMPLLDAYMIPYLAKDESDLLIQPIPMAPEDLESPPTGSLADEILRTGRVVFDSRRRAA